MVQSYLLILALLSLIDIAWVFFAGRKLYTAKVKYLLSERQNVFPAILFYVFYAAGILFFCVIPSLASGEFFISVANGLLLGFIAYGTYSLTNLSIIKGWQELLVIIDIAWGSIMTSAVSALAYTIIARFLA